MIYCNLFFALVYDAQVFKHITQNGTIIRKEDQEEKLCTRIARETAVDGKELSVAHLYKQKVQELAGCATTLNTILHDRLHLTLACVFLVSLQKSPF